MPDSRSELRASIAAPRAIKRSPVLSKPRSVLSVEKSFSRFCASDHMNAVLTIRHSIGADCEIHRHAEISLYPVLIEEANQVRRWPGRCVLLSEVERIALQFCQFDHVSS